MRQLGSLSILELLLGVLLGLEHLVDGVEVKLVVGNLGYSLLGVIVQGLRKRDSWWKFLVSHCAMRWLEGLNLRVDWVLVLTGLDRDGDSLGDALSRDRDSLGGRAILMDLGHSHDPYL